MCWKVNEILPCNGLKLATVTFNSLLIQGFDYGFCFFHRFYHYSNWNSKRTLGNLHRCNCYGNRNVSCGKSDQWFCEQTSIIQNFLELSFLLLIGFLLILEGLEGEIPKGYIYILPRHFRCWLMWFKCEYTKKIGINKRRKVQLRLKKRDEDYSSSLLYCMEKK